MFHQGRLWRRVEEGGVERRGGDMRKRGDVGTSQEMR
jgi:hypothetical protein